MCTGRKERREKKAGLMEETLKDARPTRSLFFFVSFFFFVPGAALTLALRSGNFVELFMRSCVYVFFIAVVFVMLILSRMRVRVKSMQTDARRDGSRDFYFCRVFFTGSCISYVLLLREYTYDV